MKHTTITATPPAHLTEEQYEKWIYVQMIDMHRTAGKTSSTESPTPAKIKKKKNRLGNIAGALLGRLLLTATGTVAGMLPPPLILEQYETCNESREESIEETPDKELYQVFDLGKLKQYALKSYTADEIYSFTRMLSALTRQQKLYPEVLMKTIDELEAHAHELRQKEQSARRQPKPKKAKETESKKEEKTFVPIQDTFICKTATLKVYLPKLFDGLTHIGWIGKNSKPDDFMDLFSGQLSNGKTVWAKKNGKGELKRLFRRMLDEKFIECPPGIGYLQILQSHFVDPDGNYLTGLNKTYEAKSTQMTLDACIEILKGDHETYQKMISEDENAYFDEEELYPNHISKKKYLG